MSLVAGLLGLVTMGLIGPAAQAAGQGSVTKQDACTGQVGIAFTYVNDTDAPVSFQITDTNTGAVIRSINDVPAGQTLIKASVIELDEDQSYDVTVTSTAGFSQRFAGTLNCFPDEPTKVTPTAPSFNDKPGTANDTFTVPSTEGVEYTVDGKVVAPGTYPATGSVTVVAVAKDGYAIEGKSSWTFEYTDTQPPVNEPTKVTPTAPSFNDKPGTANDTFTVPNTEGVCYVANGQALEPGTYPATGTVTVTALAKDGYAIEGKSSWTFVFTDKQPPVEQPPGDHQPPVLSQPPAHQPGTGHHPSAQPSQGVTPVNSPGLNPGFGAQTGWDENTTDQRGNVLVPALGLTLALLGLTAAAFVWRRRQTGEESA